MRKFFQDKIVQNFLVLGFVALFSTAMIIALAIVLMIELAGK